MTDAEKEQAVWSWATHISPPECFAELCRNDELKYLLYEFYLNKKYGHRYNAYDLACYLLLSLWEVKEGIGDAEGEFYFYNSKQCWYSGVRELDDEFHIKLVSVSHDDYDVWLSDAFEVLIDYERKGEPYILKDIDRFVSGRTECEAFKNLKQNGK